MNLTQTNPSFNLSHVPASPSIKLEKQLYLFHGGLIFFFDITLDSHSACRLYTMKEFRFFLNALVVVVFSCLPVRAQEDKVKKELSDLTTRAFNIYLKIPDSAIHLGKKALLIASEAKETYYEGHSYFLLSKAYWAKANYRLSTEYGFKALKLFENTNYRRDYVSSLLSVARTLIELGNYSKARELIQFAHRLSEQLSDDYINAETYREHSFLLAETGQLDSALELSDKGILLFEKLGDSLNTSILFGRKARIYFVKKDFTNSRKFAFRGMLLDTLVGNRRGLGVTYFLAAENERELKNMANAERLLKHSMRVNHEIGNLIWLVRAHELLAQLYLETKRPGLAANHLQLASQYKDSLYNAEKSGQIQEMQSLYELEGKENKIKLLEQENALHQQQAKNQRLFVAFLLAGILLLVLLIFFLTRLRTIQKNTNRDLKANNIAIEHQRKEMELQAQKLKELNDLQAKLFSVISHDLRGPIANLHSLLELFAKKMMTAEELITLSDKLKINLSVTQRTLENLLSWAMSQREGIRTDKKRVDLKACIDETCRLMEETANRKNVLIIKDIHDPLAISADPDQVQLVLRNLIHNGIKFSKNGGQIIIKAKEESEFCCISIQDFGIGMSAQEIESLLGSKEYFTKAGTDQEKGTGLGLILCREFIERNGGKLNIKSTLGKGTEVSFTLRLA